MIPRIGKRATRDNRFPMVRIAGFLALLAVIVFALSVNTFPNINNDGVDYIAYSRSLSANGLVHLGYRQIGYPLYLAATRLVSGLIGVEPLLTAVLVQRLLLVAGAGYAVWLWRWRAAPVVILVVTPSLVVYTNFVLTEALTVPLALLVACLVAHHFDTISGTRARLESDGSPRLPDGRMTLLTAWCVVVVCLLLVVIRFPFIVFGVVPVGLWVAARRRGAITRPYTTLVALYLALTTLFVIGTSIENSNEWGELRPVARTERSLYWSAWNQVFTLHPENQTDPHLSAFYDDGSPYIRIWEIESETPVYHDQAAQFRASMTEMLDAADLSLPRSRAFSLLGALRGGRLDEVRPRVDVMLDTDVANVEEAIHWNDVSDDEGWSVFNSRYNDGVRPQAMITSPVFPSPPLPYVTSLLRWLLPVSLGGTLILMLLSGRRLLGLIFLVPPLAYSIVMAWILADNARFLMTTTIYSVAGLSAMWAVAALRHGPRYRLARNHAIDEI